MREPETLTELKAEILRQLEKSETVVIKLTEGDNIHELLESITDGIKGTKELNRQSRRNFCAKRQDQPQATWGAATNHHQPE